MNDRQHSRILLSTGMALIVIAGVLLVPLGWFLGWMLTASPRVLWLLVLFSGIILEKLWAMFFRMPDRFSTRVGQDWTTVSVGLSYSAVMYLTLWELFRPLVRGLPVIVPIVGALLYAAGVGLRYWASLHLGRQWSIHLDQDLPDRRLVDTGPYARVRHPLYLAACLESLGIPMLFGAVGALALGLFAFVPLEVHRAYYEERWLAQTFGMMYHGYRNRIRGFLPFRRGP